MCAFPKVSLFSGTWTWDIFLKMESQRIQKRSVVSSIWQGRTGPPGYREISRWAPKQRVPNKINDQCRPRLCTRKNSGMIIVDVNSSLILGWLRLLTY